MMLPMLSFLLAFSAHGQEIIPTRQDAFASSYGVFVSVYRGQCTYFLTDVGLNSSQLAEELKTAYDAARGLEILLDASTPFRCVTEARKSALRAGFKNVRARMATEKDRLPGIP